MPKPTIVDFVTIGTASIMQPLFDLAWDVFGSDTEDRPVNTVDEAREKLKAVAQAGDTMTGPLTLPASDPTLNNHATRKAYVDDSVEAAKQYTDDQIEATLEAIYPVGSLYFCTAATDPNSALPGTWTLLTEGQFLVSAGGTGDYALGETGGADEVTLTEEQMPSHTHTYQPLRVGVGAVITQFDSGAYAFGAPVTNSGAAGEDQPHENRPPYLAVNMWQRTA